MNIKELFKGVAVVIDDKINDTESGDLILKIVEKLINYNIPVIKYVNLPENKEINNFKNISFLLLDWELFDGSLRGTRAAQKEIDRNFRFIRKIRKISFIPIFIFSNETPNTIINSLSDKNLYKKNENNYIFVKRKQDLFTGNGSFKMYNEIKKWLKQTPSIYVLKVWEKALNDAKNKLFWDFYNINHKWPSVLQKTFQDDGSDVNYELGNFIFKNIMARTEPIKFDKDILKIEDDNLTQEEIRKVLEAERFLKSDSLPPDIPFTGDLFKVFRYELSENATSEKEHYFLNIRPDCDIAIRRGVSSNPDLYCLECEIVDETKINNGNSNNIIFNKGTFIDKTNNTYIAFIDSGKILQIKLKEVKTFKWNQELFTNNNNGQKRILKTTRIGRILPPYITAIQQKFSFYLQRQGLPAIPEKAIKDE